MKKIPYLHPSLSPEKILKKDSIRTWSRSSIINESFISKKFEIYNGKTFTSIIIQPEMVGIRLGEFARTRKRGKDPRPKLSSRRRLLLSIT